MKHFHLLRLCWLKLSQKKNAMEKKAAADSSAKTLHPHELLYVMHGVYGLSQNYGYPSGVLLVRIITFWDLYWLPHILGNCHVSKKSFEQTLQQPSCSSAVSGSKQPLLLACCLPLLLMLINLLELQ